MKHTLSKTILAFAVTAATASAFAVPALDLNQDVSGLNEVSFTRIQVGNVTLQGDANRAPGQDGAGFEGVFISGDLTNNANVNAQGNFVDGLDLDSTEGGDPLKTTVGGSLLNNGVFTLSGIAPVGIISDGANIAGSVVNNGNMTINGLDNTIDADTPRAIELGNTQLGGDVVNTAKLSVNGRGAKGIYAFSSPDAATRGSIAKDVINKGVISVAGDDSAAISLNDIEFSRDVVNQGRLEASGANASGVQIKDMMYNAVANTGTIAVTGKDSVAVRFQDSTNPTSHLATNGVVNSGDISATGTAIKVESLTQTTAKGGDDNPSNLFVIHQNGGNIIGGDKSIDGNFQTKLEWTAGTITGDIEGLTLMQVAGNGTFNGNEIEALLVDVKSGTLYTASSSTNLTGDLSVAAAGSLQVRVSDLTSTTTPLVNVDGIASFEKGSKIGVTATPDDFKGTREGKTYTLVKAGYIDDGGLTVVSNSALLNITGFKVDEETVTATVTGQAGPTVSEIIRGLGATGNAGRAIVPFADSVIGQLDANDPVFIAFANADAKELARLAEQLSPDVSGGATQAALGGQTLVSKALNERNSEVRGKSSGDVLLETGVWVKGLYSDADQGTRDGISGYNAYSSGIVVGADGKLTTDVTLGVAYSYIKSDVNSQFNQTEVDMHALTAYGSWSNGPAFVDASVTAGKNDNTSKRDVAGTQAKGDYDSELFGANVLAGYGFGFENGFVVEPRAALRYANVKIDGYTEKNSSAALNVGGQRIEVGEFGAGVRVAKDFAFMNGTFKPEATAMAYHDFIGDKANTTSTFLLGGSPFVTSGASTARDSYEFGLGAKYSIGAVTVGANYSYLTKTDFNSDTFSVAARYDF